MSTPFGDFFAEEIEKGKKTRSMSAFLSKPEDERHVFRIATLIIFFVGGLALLLSRLFVITILEGERYQQISRENRIREVRIQASRGILYDREGIPLVRNIPIFVSSSGEVFFEQKPEQFAGELVESVAREYVFGDLFAHAIGYTGEVNKSELENQKSDGMQISYQPGDVIGRMGIEESKDAILRGIAGRTLYEVDATGKLVRVLGKIDPKSGRNLSLTLSTRLQERARDAFAGKKGAVIASVPTTGEVLVLYSSPSFDPNIFVRGGDVRAVFSDTGEPLYNRVVAGLYPPASTFKIVTAMAALESGAITKDTKVEDTGVLKVGEFSFGNWYFSQYGKKEGIVDMVKALKRSNDIFFYKVGELTGIETLALWGKKVGIERDNLIDLPGEVKGLMPDPVWRKKVKGEQWFLGNTYHVAIGQGDVLATPLAVNAWTNSIASSGKRCTFHLLSEQKENCEDLGIREETRDLIREGMKEACLTGGTGWPLFKFKVKNEKLKVDGIDYLTSFESTISGRSVVEIPVACKTGTAEFGDPKKRTHAWFTVFAPVYHPQISITVVVEAGGEGSSVAAPIAKSVLEEWFGK